VTWGLGVVVVMIGILIGGWFLRTRLGWETPPATINLAQFSQLTDRPGEELTPSLSPDAKSFVYTSPMMGNWDIYLQRVGGQNPVNLTKASTAHDTQPAYSPDGEQIAFRSERDGGGIFLMEATGENVKRLTDFGYNPAWSPDGKEIACAIDAANPTGRFIGSQLWVVNVTTGQKRSLPISDAVQPAWSPHGHRIAYWGVHQGGQRDLWTIATGGGEPLAVTDDAFTDWNPVWSPDGRHLYFISDRGGSMNLWQIPIDEQTGVARGSPEPLTTPSPYIEHVSLSRDGRRLAYVSQASRISLQTVAFDPVKETVVGQPTWLIQGSRQAKTADFSSDGEWIVFATLNPQEDLFVIRKDGTGLRQLTDDVWKDRRPRWSPDGKRIAFYSDRDGRYQVWSINLDGSGLQQLTYAPEAFAMNPVWSPDATRMVFAVPYVYKIMDVDRPWNQQTPQALPPASFPLEIFRVYTWSPDGQMLAGWRGHKNDTGGGIVLYSLDSQQYELLTEVGTAPIWLSDNRRLMFLHQGKVHLVDRQSKKVREILSLAPRDVERVSINRDDRLLCVDVSVYESDIWLVTLEQE
jgi:Tol biopolymer transport system component